MAVTLKAKPGGEPSEIEGIEEALKTMRDQGHAEGRAEGYSAGRADAAAILALPEAEGRAEMAAELAKNHLITPDSAKGILSKAPKADTTAYSAALKAASPKLGVGDDTVPGGDAETKQAERRAQLSGLVKGLSTKGVRK